MVPDELLAHRAESVRSRPPVLRALGADEPPDSIQIFGQPHRIVRVFKHDSWAATALYTGPEGLVVCKFHRQQRIGVMPMRWLGRLLANRERSILKKLGDLANVPRWSGEVSVNGRRLPYAVAHEYVPGRPLDPRESVDDEFFPRLVALLQEVHQRGLAYLDLHKRENILVGDDGQPYLIDFQISVDLSSWRLGRTMLGRSLLREFQASDRYHLQKHVVKLRPDQASTAAVPIPIWIRFHRLVAMPFRALRRRLLVGLGVRSGRGRVESEAFQEERLRTTASFAT